MFNNTFNRNRKDPLVDSIKAIMEDTNMRNQAEGLVCEAFGVFNANALANEDIEIFKDACEFVYSQLKEGVQLDELLGRGKLDAAVKSHLEKKGYTHTKSKDPEGGTRHSFEKAAKTPFKGEKKGFSYTRYKEKGEKHGDVNFGYYSKSAKSKKPNYGESGNDPESNLPSLVKSMKEGVQIDEMAHKALTAAGYKAGPKDSTTGFGRTYTKGKKSVYVDADGFARHGSGSKATVTHGNKETAAYLNREKKMEEGNDGNLANNYPPYDKVTRGDVIAGRLGKDQMGGKRKKMDEEQIDELYGKGQIHKLRKGIRDEGQALSQEYGEGKYHNKRKRTPSDHGKHGAYLKKARKVWDKSRRADALADAIAAKNLAKKKQAAAFDKNPKRKISEEVFEELYISINEQALYAIETNQLEAFINNLTEEEYDFLDEEIVNEIAMGFAGAAGASANKSMNKTSVAPRKSSSLAGGSVSMAPSANAKPPASSHKSAASSGTGKSGYFSGSPNVSKGDYTVKSGENLSGIAKRLGTSVGAIQSMNKGMSDPNKIASGAKLNLPTIKTGNQMGPPASAAPSSSTGNRISPAPKTDSTDTSPGPNVQRDKTPSGNPGGETGIKSGNTVSLDRQVKDYADSNKPSDSAMAKTASNNNAPKDQAGAGNVDSQVSKRNFLDKQLKGDSAGAGGMQVTESVERKGFVTVGNMRIKLL